MKIDMTEVQNQKTALSTSKTSLSNQIETAKSSFVNLVNSESLKGDVKSAINAKISNHQIPLLTNFSNAMSVLSAQYDKTIEQFQTTVSETAADAIIDTDYLQGIIDGFSGLETNISSVDRETASIYNSISDIISLTNPDASTITTPLSEGKTILTDTKTNMESFNGWERGDEYSELLLVQVTALKGLEAAGKSPFTSKDVQAFYNGTAFMNGVENTANAIMNSTPLKLLDFIADTINNIKNYIGEESESVLQSLETEAVKAASTKGSALANTIIKIVAGRKFVKSGVQGAGFVMVDATTRSGSRALARLTKSLQKGEKLPNGVVRLETLSVDM